MAQLNGFLPPPPSLDFMDLKSFLSLFFLLPGFLLFSLIDG